MTFHQQQLTKTHIYNPNTWKVKAGKSGIQGQSQVYSKFKASPKLNETPFQTNLPTNKPTKMRVMAWWQITIYIHKRNSVIRYLLDTLKSVLEHRDSVISKNAHLTLTSKVVGNKVSGPSIRVAHWSKTEDNQLHVQLYYCFWKTALGKTFWSIDVIVYM